MGEVLDGGDSIAPYYVRRAELYMRLNLATHITVQGLSRVSGVSARTLAYGFRKFRNTSPMVYLRTIRLDLARSLLCSNDVAITVAKVAERCGIPHHGRFAGWYYERYCELPSQTIDRARRLALAKMVTTPAKD